MKFNCNYKHNEQVNSHLEGGFFDVVPTVSELNDGINPHVEFG